MSSSQKEAPAVPDTPTRKTELKKRSKICLFFIPIKQNAEVGNPHAGPSPHLPVLHGDHLHPLLHLHSRSQRTRSLQLTQCGPFGLIGFIMSVMTLVTGFINLIRIKQIFKDQDDDGIESFIPIKW